MQLHNFVYDSDRKRYVLIDFGGAVILPFDSRIHRHPFCGASDRAPELQPFLNGESEARPISCAADVYALGVVLGSFIIMHWQRGKKKEKGSDDEPDAEPWMHDTDVPRYYREHFERTLAAVSRFDAEWCPLKQFSFLLPCLLASLIPCFFSLLPSMTPCFFPCFLPCSPPSFFS